MKAKKERFFNIATIEIIVFAIIWLVLYAIPYLQKQSTTTVYWDKVTKEWVRTTALLLIFILNISVLVPRLLFLKKYFKYILSVVILIVLTNLASISLLNFVIDPEPIAMPRMELGPGMPPMELGDKMPAPMGYRVPEQEAKPSLIMQGFNGFVISLLVIGASIAFKMMSKWLSEESLRKDVEKEQLLTELAFLRHQLSPHFFMNTLNNIHALIDINTETAKDAVIRLSTLMRYLLYETSQGNTKLKKEIDFLESYISLMKLRYSEKVLIKMDIPQQIPDIEIPPMLFVSFLENAFKHGVSYQQKSFISFAIEIVEDKIQCVIKNSKHSVNQINDKKYSGIGLTNIRKSLDLLYQKNYKLNIVENEKEFEVQLIIPKYDNKMLSN